MSMIQFALVLCSVLMVAGGQLMFKLLGARIQSGIPLQDPKILGIAVVAFAVYGLATLLWIHVLRTLPLTKAYPFMALSFVLVPIGGILFFSETIRLSYVAGIILIVVGVVLTGLPGPR